MIGLRLVADHPRRFDRVVISNTGLPYNPDAPDRVVSEIEDIRTNAGTPSLPEMTDALRDMGGLVGSSVMKFAYWQ